jgi:molybdopterin/thiamine biosynthesis adenylyltransferase
MSSSAEIFYAWFEKPENNSFKPIVFKLSNSNDISTLEHFLSLHSEIKLVDTLHQQIRELAKLSHPHKVLSEDDYNTFTDTYLAAQHPYLAGSWCYYPWLNTLVHLLNKDDFIQIRTNRNQLKITPEEQSTLKEKTIGVIGLSVGQAIAITAVMERICGKIKLADFDTVDLSNLNRLRTGVQHLGQSKVILAAREIAEIDPYIEVEIHNQGISSTNIDDFIKDLSVLIEVCDDMPTKINSRLIARKHKVPVVMDTNDRGMVDVERFDLEPNRPILHGLVNEDQLQQLDKLTPEARLKLVMDIVSFPSTSSRLKASMEQIGKTITTWPQLASSIMLGAGATVDCCRRILLKQTHQSGRYYIDLDILVP